MRIGVMRDCPRGCAGLRRTQGNLRANGLDFRDVVRDNIDTTNLDAFIGNKDVRKEYCGKDFPAATWMQVERLYSPSFVVEVELTAEFK